MNDVDVIKNTGSNENNASHRLAKWIAGCGYCSRRAAERLITAGKVLFNGRLATHTDQVTSGDVILINGQRLVSVAAKHYVMYHKPVGIDCNIRAADPASLFHLINSLPQRLFAIGRLDKDSSGLLLLTNDGELAQRLIHPDYYHEKSYKVDVDRPITEPFLQQMAQGVSWQTGHKQFQSRPCTVQQLATQQFRITLTQGLHRQIRYMCKALGYRVTALCRDRLHQLTLSDLAVGQLRTLSADEVTALRN